MNRYALGVAVAVLTTAPAAPACAKDSIPTRRAARADMVRNFPAAAPTSLLKVPEGVWRTRRLTVVPASQCTRTSLRVACRFRLLLIARHHQFAPVRCHGELWARRSRGVIVGRVGDYVCRSVTS
jgi:hypothetical protein